MPGIGGLAKNRVRAMSNVSLLDQAIPIQAAVPTATQETEKEEKTWKSEIIAALTPWDPEDFEGFG